MKNPMEKHYLAGEALSFRKGTDEYWYPSSDAAIKFLGDYGVKRITTQQFLRMRNETAKIHRSRLSIVK